MFWFETDYDVIYWCHQTALYKGQILFLQIVMIIGTFSLHSSRMGFHWVFWLFQTKLPDGKECMAVHENI